jgi:hypothetical protein
MMAPPRDPPSLSFPCLLLSSFFLELPPPSSSSSSSPSSPSSSSAAASSYYINNPTFRPYSAATAITSSAHLTIAVLIVAISAAFVLIS